MRKLIGTGGLYVAAAVVAFGTQGCGSSSDSPPEGAAGSATAGAGGSAAGGKGGSAGKGGASGASSGSGGSTAGKGGAAGTTGGTSGKGGSAGVGTGGTAGAGAAGASGKGGSSGAAGMSGSAGVGGLGGAAGVAGMAGSAGKAGASGAGGKAGAAGASGKAGAAGASGAGGVGGKAGASGTGGSAGASGAGGAGAPGCFDMKKDNLETDVDCGGGVCVPCKTGKDCKVGGDCTTGFCDGVVCVDSHCNDKVKDANETDVDCGGPTCGGCGNGKGCATPGDCTSGLCDGTVCVDSHCKDLAKDADETDVDCGGATCTGCASGKSCAKGGDCASTYCDGALCVDSHCKDKSKDVDESDVDCGGSCGATCVVGQSCAAPADCASGACDGVTGKCVSSQCVDQVKNGNETDVDCGGGVCVTCATGLGCLLPTDCTSTFCDGAACVDSHCKDKAKDADETDVDCGGATCSPCATGAACALPADCASAICSKGQCYDVAASCAQVLALGKSTGDGLYTIDVDGVGGIAPFQVFCDMTFQGGGWTLILSTVGGLGPQGLAPGFVSEGSAAFMPIESMKVLATGSHQAHMRTAKMAATRSITSVPDTQPIKNLASGLIMNSNAVVAFGGSAAAFWTGPFADESHLAFDCGVPPFGAPSANTVYPNMYWACDNGVGTHLIATNSTWRISQANEPMEVYVKLATTSVSSRPRDHASITRPLSFRGAPAASGRASASTGWHRARSSREERGGERRAQIETA